MLEKDFALEILDYCTKISDQAKKETKCLRKGVGCMLFGNGSIVTAYNGNHGCLNVPGGCGCGHAEPRVILKGISSSLFENCFMICTYSPCINCANVIMDSGIVKGLVFEIMTRYDDPKLDELANLAVIRMSKKFPVLLTVALREFVLQPSLWPMTKSILKTWMELNNVKAQ